MEPELSATSALCIDDKRIRRADCEHCAIRTRMLFADIDVVAAGHLLEPISNVGFLPGDTIYSQGGKPSAMYSIRKGVVKLSLLSTDGDLRIVRLLGPGAAIGLESLLQQTYHHTAEPLSEVDTCRLPTDSVRQIASEQPTLYRRLMQQWETHLELADEHLLKLSAGPVNDRVMNLLILLDDICQHSDMPLLLPTNQDCAALVAARVESVSRVMAELKRADTLTRNTQGDWAFHRA